VTSNGLGSFADRPVGRARMALVLAPDCCAIAHLRSASFAGAGSSSSTRIRSSPSCRTSSPV